MSEISFEKYKVLFKSLPKFWSINKFVYFYYTLYKTIKKRLFQTMISLYRMFDLNV